MAININTLNGGNITITTGPAARAVTRVWWSNDESDYSDCPSNNGTFDSSCFPEGKSNYEIWKVEFGTDVRILGDYCFQGSSISSVVIPRTITSIGEYAFCNCALLTSVTIDNGVANIGSQAFRDCPTLTSIIIPNSVINIGQNVFDEHLYDTTTITGLSLVDGWVVGSGDSTNIDLTGTRGVAAFSFEYSSIEHLTIPDTYTHIGGNAFASCYSLNEVTITANGGNANNVKQMLINADVYDENITWNMPN